MPKTFKWEPILQEREKGTESRGFVVSEVQVLGATVYTFHV
jgi:hypothetical protein